MWFWRMNLVVLPSQTLSDSQASPLILLQYLEGASLGVEVILGDHLEHAFRKHHMPGRRARLVVSSDSGMLSLRTDTRSGHRSNYKVLKVSGLDVPPRIS